jgi:hypothetical protein
LEEDEWFEPLEGDSVEPSVVTEGIDEERASLIAWLFSKR